MILTHHAILIFCSAWLGLSAWALAQDRAAKIRDDRKTVEGDGYWIYNDLGKGFDQAAKSNKPLLVVIRCIPCEACAKLDQRVVDRDPAVNTLLDEFVCVRIVQANHLDLALFQYDYDQSFAAFFLNADRTIYGRFGTRSHETQSDRDVSVAGFAKALAGALELHKNYPANKAPLAGKHGPKPLVAVPEDFSSLVGRYGPRLDYEGAVVKSCIHCHQVGEAMRRFYRDKQTAIPEHVLFPYPLPNILGLVMDPNEKATVLKVTHGSSAADDGFVEGDEIVSLAGQPLVSIADVQWVLHNAADAGELPAQVLRKGKTQALPLSLAKGWRRNGDLSWRATSWDLRRMTLGGMRLDTLSREQREEAGLDAAATAFRVRHVGEYGEHAVAKQAGFQKGDVLLSINGKNDYRSESEIMASLVNARQPGDQVEFAILRGGKRMTLGFRVQ